MLYYFLRNLSNQNKIKKIKNIKIKNIKIKHKIKNKT